MFKRSIFIFCQKIFLRESVKIKKRMFKNSLTSGGLKYEFLSLLNIYPELGVVSNEIQRTISDLNYLLALSKPKVQNWTLVKCHANQNISSAVFSFFCNMYEVFETL